MLKSYKYRLLPTADQKKRINSFMGACRFVYNLGLEAKIAAWVSARRSINCFDLNKQLTDLKNSGQADWLNECPVQCMQMAFRNLDNAYTKFFKGAGFPKFKKRDSHQSIQFPQRPAVKEDKVFLSKLKWVDFIQHRPLGSGKIKTVTVSKTTTNKYFVSILIDDEAALPKAKKIEPQSSVGVDMGINTLATLSDGGQYDNPKWLQSSLKRLRIEHRKLHRKYKKGQKEQSKGFYKQRLVVAKLQEKTTNQRKDYLHKMSFSILKQYDTVCIEDLNVAGMIKGRLSKSISDASWAEFFRLLKYKAEWDGKNVITIGRFDPSSKICSNCGNIFKELKLSDRAWVCESCGTAHNRDRNAAVNIKNFGLRQHLRVD
jgi:putative transposase